MSKWTKGPWFAHGPINPNRRDWGIVAGSDYEPSSGARRRIAWVGNSSNVHQSASTSAEIEANAHLIAAAPDLFSALAALVENDEEYIRINNLAGAEDNQVLCQARAALAKAKGASHE